MPVTRRFGRESFYGPVEVYQLLKRSGMDLVTITGHDSIGASESLERFPDFFARWKKISRKPDSSWPARTREPAKPGLAHRLPQQRL